MKLKIKQKGSALIYAIIIIGTVGAIAFGVAQMSMKKTQTFAQVVDGIQAYFLAESGTEIAYTLRRLYSENEDATIDVHTGIDINFSRIPPCILMKPSEIPVGCTDYEAPCGTSNYNCAHDGYQPNQCCQNACIKGRVSSVFFRGILSNFVSHDLNFLTVDPSKKLFPSQKAIELRVYQPEFGIEEYRIQTRGIFGQGSTPLNSKVWDPAGFDLPVAVTIDGEPITPPGMTLGD